MPAHLANPLISQVEKLRFRIHGHQPISNHLALGPTSCGSFKTLVGIWEGNYAFVYKVFDPYLSQNHETFYSNNCCGKIAV